MNHYNKHRTCAAWAEHGGKRTSEGARIGVGRRERMKRDSGIKDRDDRSRGIEILMSHDRFFHENQTNRPI